MAVELSGWYVDAMEQHLGALISKQRMSPMSVEELCELFIDPTTDADHRLSPEQHTATLALCMAICVHRLAQIDVLT